MKQIDGTVTYNYKDATGKDASETSPVSYPEYESAEDVLTALSKADKSATESLLAALNYGENLKARASARAILAAKLEGPGKAIDKMVDQFVKARAAAGKPVTEEQARKAVTAMLDAGVLEG